MEKQTSEGKELCLPVQWAASSLGRTEAQACRPRGFIFAVSSISHYFYQGRFFGLMKGPWRTPGAKAAMLHPESEAGTQAPAAHLPGTPGSGLVPTEPRSPGLRQRASQRGHLFPFLPGVRETSRSRLGTPVTCIQRNRNASGRHTSRAWARTPSHRPRTALGPHALAPSWSRALPRRDQPSTP